MTVRIIPDDQQEMLAVFRRLCEDYADGVDGGGVVKRDKARKELLSFCHAYAYKVNGVKPWI